LTAAELRFVELLRRTNYVGASPYGEPKPAPYIELHIEQGPILDREGGVLGAVESLQGISWQEFVIRGKANQSSVKNSLFRR
jgi:N-carbamoyl-L-amino-acid hydrolase